MKRVLIDANPVVPYYVSGRVSGIGRTTKELIEALTKVPDLPFEIMLYSQNMKGIGGRNMDVPFKSRHLYLPNRKQVNKILSHLPVRELLTGYDLMHITHNFEYVAHPEKCVVTLHDALFMRTHEDKFNHVGMRRIVPPFIRRCKHVITCSEASKRDIVDTMGVSPEKITVIYWGVNHTIFYPQTNKEDVRLYLDTQFNIRSPYFLSVSCNAERKRTNILVKSYLELLRTNDSIENDLVLVWGDPPQDLLIDIHNSGFEHRIHFLKNISDADLAVLYNGAVAMFFPSSYEGFGLPLLEAMACGTPVITCRNSSLDEIAADAGIYLNEPLSENIMDTMKSFDTKTIDTKSFVELGLNRARMFDWTNTVKDTIKVYSKALNLI